MHWTSSSIALTLSAAVALFAPSARAQTLAPGEIARVADLPILKTEFDHWHDVWMRQGQAPTDELMDLLITRRWTQGEAARLGIVVTPGAVYTRYKREMKASFGTEAAFQRYLTETGMTVADIKTNVRTYLLATRIRDHVERGAKTAEGKQRLLERFRTRHSARWKSMTVCGQGYENEADCGSVVPLST